MFDGGRSSSVAHFDSPRDSIEHVAGPGAL